MENNNNNNKKKKEKPMNVKVLMKDPLAEVGSERLRLETNLVNQED